MSAFNIPNLPYPVIPTLPGLGWNVKRSPQWNTLVQKTASGLDSEAALMAYPLWNYDLTYNVLRGDLVNLEYQQLVGHFNLCKGQAVPFCFLDPDDFNVPTQTLFGTGDGVSNEWQLFRLFGSVYEPVLAPYGGVTVYSGGTLLTPITQFSVSNLGLVTFPTPPALGAQLTWTGQFYWICRYLQDTIEFEKFAQNYWLNKKIQFTTKKLYSLGTTA
jgi:uncharacterized protein (TIGR02217 family)